MVNCAPDDIISWVPAGDAFRISDLQRLENETLPSFFRHSRFQSLVRQLNFYNFRKVNRERNFWIYRHKQFHRDRPEQLHLLRRRTCPGVDGRKQRPEIENPNRAAERTLLHLNQANLTGSSQMKEANQYLESRMNHHLSVGSSEYGMTNESRLIDSGLVESEKHVILESRSETDLLAKETSLGQVYVCNYSDSLGISDRKPSNQYGGMSQANHNEGIFLLNKLRQEYISNINNDKINQHDATQQKVEKIGNSNDIVVRDDLQSVKSYQSLSDESYGVKDENSSSRSIDGSTTLNASETVIRNAAGTPPIEDGARAPIYHSDLTSRKRAHDAERQGFRSVEKPSRAEQNKHSMLVSQVARELEVYARRAAESGMRGGRGKGGRGRRAGAGVLAGRGVGGIVTPTPMFGDTMRYNALTYDDEASRSDLDDRGSLKKRKAETVVTDESDSSEADDAMSVMKTTKGSSYLENSAENVKSKTVDVAATAHVVSQSQIDNSVDHALIASISRKLLHGLGPLDARKDNNAHLLSASLSCFCMSNNPLDPELGYKVDLLLETCVPLYEDFQRYLKALSPSSVDCCSSCTRALDLNLVKVGGTEAVRDFKIFAVNCMEGLLSKNNYCLQQQILDNVVHLTEDEANVLQACTEMWCKNIAVQMS